MTLQSVETARALFARLVPIESIRYAFRRDLVVLYLTTWFGWRLFEFSQSFEFLIAGDGLRTFETLSSVPFTVAGVALFVGGLVGVVHNVLTDLLPTR